MTSTRALRGAPAVEPFFFGSSAQPLFGCYNAPQGAGERDCGVVLCAPIGQEYFRSHRALKQLASRLAALGLPVLRFDYFGCGDSAGDGEDSRLSRWLLDIAAAVDEMRCRGPADICLVGFRLGGTLAWLAGAGTCEIRRLVVWDPVIDGRGYLRELECKEQQMLNSLGLRPATRDEGRMPLESLGYHLTEELRGELEQIDLTGDRRRPAAAALVLESASTVNLGRLADHLGTLGVAAEHRQLSGPVFWVQDPESALVPHHALQMMTSWIEGSGT
jgi:pimeloyl-ACP methyl ester carboxylesterase